jgi:mannose-6-phosphate isomerase-like protein (cupin superfamily)
MTNTSARKAVAEKARSTYRKTATKAVAEKARGTSRKTAAQFEEFVGDAQMPESVRALAEKSVAHSDVQPGDAMKGYVHTIEKAALKNKTFRTVLYTAKNCQLVVMSLKPGEDIGEEVHKLDQFLRVEKGKGKAVLDGVEHRIKPGFAILVPAGTRHNLINGPSGRMKLYTLYAPPNHRDGVVHATKADAEADKEHFDGKTTE